MNFEIRDIRSNRRYYSNTSTVFSFSLILLDNEKLKICRGPSETRRRPVYVYHGVINVFRIFGTRRSPFLLVNPATKFGFCVSENKLKIRCWNKNTGVQLNIRNLLADKKTTSRDCSTAYN